jgi:glycosyltransferase involved in cell wall biosynthesis
MESQLTDKNYFPRVLIVGQNFNNISGGGITLSNLFSGWDKDSIAVISKSIDYKGNNICEKYYQIGNLENKRPFPFNFIRLKVKSGGTIITRKENIVSEQEQKNILKGFYLGFNKIIVSSLEFLGLSNILYNWENSPELIKWINEFKPDLIYTQLSNLILIRFVQNLHNLLNIPVAIHIMDDWPATICKGTLFSSYWRKVIANEFRYLLDNARILFSISEFMSEEYKIRYEKKFIPFYNPIETDRWLEVSKMGWEVNKTFTVLYAGRIGLGTSDSLVDIANAVSNIAKEGYDIEFQIQTPNVNSKIIKKLKKIGKVVINPFLEYRDLPRKLSSVDLLVLPIDFDKKSVKFIKFSMPTKTSEYMSTATPVLVYAPEQTALAKYALKYNWAYVVTENKIETICQALKNLYEREDLRRELGMKAKKIAVEKNDAKKVREEFRSVLSAK